MSRWIARIVGVMMLLMFVLVFTHLYKQLVMLQKMQQPATSRTK